MSFAGLDDLAAKQLMSGRFSVPTDQLNLTSGLTTVFISARGINLQSGITANQISGLLGYQMSGATSGYILVSDNSGAGSWQATSVATTHNLLSATHPDTLPAVVVRGDLIVASSVPKWSRLPVGTYGQPVVADGTDTGFSSSGIIGNIISGNRALFTSGIEVIFISGWGLRATSGNITLGPAKSGHGVTTLTGDLLLNPTLAIKAKGTIVPSTNLGADNDLIYDLGSSTSRWLSLYLGDANLVSGITAIQISGLRGFQMSGANSGYVLTQDGSGIGTWKVSPSAGTTFDVMSGNSIWLQSGLRADTISGNDGSFTVTLKALNLAFTGASSGFTLGMQRNIFMPPASSGFGLTTESGDLLIAPTSGTDLRIFTNSGRSILPSTLSGTTQNNAVNLGNSGANWLGIYGGQLRLGLVTYTGSGTIKDNESFILADSTAAQFDIILPNAINNLGRIIWIKTTVSTNPVRIISVATDAIEASGGLLGSTTGGIGVLSGLRMSWAFIAGNAMSGNATGGQTLSGVWYRFAGVAFGSTPPAI